VVAHGARRRPDAATLIAASRAGRRLRAAGVRALVVLILVTTPAWAHHVGSYTPRDNDVSANFKQIKFAIQARKFEVALRLFDEGPLRPAMRARAGTLPAGLEAAARSALEGGDAAAAETTLAVFFAALARELAVEADATVADPQRPAAARAAAGGRFLEAIWRYWNLVDFVVSEHDPRSAVAIRLAFDEADSLGRSGAAPAVNPGAAPKRSVAPAATADPAAIRAPLARIVQALDDVIRRLSTSPRRRS
jgi:hypothetical protein